MRSILIVSVLFDMILICTTHLCLLAPKQWGSISGLNTPGSPDCGLTKYPCGGRDPGNLPNDAWKIGGNFTVIFQKNLNHYTSANPGYFSVSLAGDGMHKELSRVVDRNEPSLHLYEVSGPLPSGLYESARYWVEVSYITKNSNVPPAFYQCSDVIMLQANST